MSKYRNQELIEDIEDFLYAPERQYNFRDPFGVRYYTDTVYDISYYTTWGAANKSYVQPLAKIKDDRCSPGYCSKCSEFGSWKWGHDAFYTEGEMLCPIKRDAIMYNREFAAMRSHP